MSLFEKKTFLSNKLAKLYAENQTTSVLSAYKIG